MVDYTYYTQQWGGEMSREEFERAEPAAAAQLRRYKRIYKMRKSTMEQEQQAVCAMADAISYFEQAENGEVSGSMQLGSLKVERAAGTVPELTPRAKSRELYRCAGLYLDIYRGVQEDEVECGE